MVETLLTDRDQELVALLRRNARMSTTEIARRLGVSRTTAQSRIERLERGGVIAGYTVRFSEAYEASMVRALVLIVCTPKATPGVIEALRRRDFVSKIHSVSGSYDLVAEVCTDGVAGLDAAIDVMGDIEGVDRTTSLIVLSTRFQR